MNANNVLKRGESKYDAMERIGKAAAAKQGMDAEFEPIMLTINNEQKTTWTASTFDVYLMSENEVASGKIVRSISIARSTEGNNKNWLTFVEHPDLGRLYAYVPRTAFNMRLLASHILDNYWTINNASALEEAKAIQKTMPVIRNPLERSANKMILKRDAIERSQKEVLLRELEEMKIKNKMLQNKIDTSDFTQSTSIAMPEPLPEKAPEAVQKRTPEQAKARQYEQNRSNSQKKRSMELYYRDETRRIMEERHHTLIESCKAMAPDRYWLIPKYREAAAVIRKELMDNPLPMPGAKAAA